MRFLILICLLLTACNEEPKVAKWCNQPKEYSNKKIVEQGCNTTITGYYRCIDGVNYYRGQMTCPRSENKAIYDVEVPEHLLEAK
jgi:hypothetical protein